MTSVPDAPCRQPRAYGHEHRRTSAPVTVELEAEGDALLRWFFDLYDMRAVGEIDDDRYLELGDECSARLRTVLGLLYTDGASHPALGPRRRRRGRRS